MADPAPGISATSHEDNLRYFDVVIAGPNQSPFQGNSFIHKDVQRRMRDTAEAVLRVSDSYAMQFGERLIQGTVMAGRKDFVMAKQEISSADTRRCLRNR